MDVVYGIPIIGVLFQFIGYVIEVTPGIAPIVLGLATPYALLGHALLVGPPL